MKNYIIGFLVLSITFLLYNQFLKQQSCAPGSSDSAVVCKSPIAVYEDPTRIPLRNFVLESMGDLHGKSIVDIGAGPGFFAFEMSETANFVYATEIDEMFLKYMEEKKTKLDLKNLKVLEGKNDHDELQDLHVDYALMVFVFHYLEDPGLFLKQLKQGLNPGGEVFIANAQMSSTIIKDYLQQAGFVEKETYNFTFFQSGGCGELAVDLIHAQWPDGLTSAH